MSEARRKKLDADKRAKTVSKQIRQKKQESTPPTFSLGIQIAVFAVLVALAALGWTYLDLGPKQSKPREPAPPPIPDFKHEYIPGSVTHALGLRDLPGKGKGLVALRDIQAGEMIIREKPLLLVTRESKLPPQKVISEALSGLNITEKEQLFSLSYNRAHIPPAPSDVELAFAIIRQNAVAAGPNVGVFPLTARLNHGCSAAFNAVYVWYEMDDGGHVVVHALKDIKEGEEVLTVYTDTKKPRTERRAYLKHQYNFDCHCKVCTLPYAESIDSDARLSRMSGLHDEFATWSEKGMNGSTAIAAINEIWRLGEAEGYISQRGRLAHDAVLIAAAHSDTDSAKAWARLAAKWYKRELGRFSTFVAESQLLAANPRQSSNWGTREDMSVGPPLYK